MLSALCTGCVQSPQQAMGYGSTSPSSVQLNLQGGMKSLVRGRRHAAAWAQALSSRSADHPGRCQEHRLPAYVRIHQQRSSAAILPLPIAILSKAEPSPGFSKDAGRVGLGPASVVFALFRVSGRYQRRCVPASKQVGIWGRSISSAAALQQCRRPASCRINGLSYLLNVYVV